MRDSYFRKWFRDYCALSKTSEGNENFSSSERLYAIKIRKKRTSRDEKVTRASCAVLPPWCKDAPEQAIAKAKPLKVKPMSK